MSKINFSISPSSVNQYRDSQLVFYYNYISNERPDSKVYTCYGKAGNVVHDITEAYINDRSINIEEEFYRQWQKKGLESDYGLNKKPLNQDLYLGALKRAVNLVDTKYNDCVAEESIEWVLHEDEEFKLRCKGIIDVQCEHEGKPIIVDWKTSSSVHKGKAFEFQGKHYCYLVWKKKGYVPEKVIFEYVKINKTKSFSFTEEDMIEHEKAVNEFKDEILEKRTDITKYEIGDIDSPFNAHTKKCKAEIERRKNKDAVVATIQNGEISLNEEHLPDKLLKSINSKYSYFVPGYHFSDLYKKRIWDGKKYFFKNGTLPIGFLNDLKQLVEDYNNHFDNNLKFKVNDQRVKDITNKTFGTDFKESEFELRDYQEEAIETGLEEKIGILYLGTGAGKTLIAAEMMKQLDRRTLFLVNRVELLRQTQEVLEDYLGVDVGVMTDGELDVKKQITVASIQTIHAILKRKDKTSKKLRLYLHNITAMFYDEAQNLSDSGMYGTVGDHLNNCEYYIGLSGSPWRNSGDTMEMNALCGFPIYRKSTEELEKDGWLCPTKCYFIENTFENADKFNDYNTEYKSLVVENAERNYIISKVVSKYQEEKKILVLTRRVAHAKSLGEKIENSRVITGSTDKTKRKEWFSEFKENDGVVLIGSSKIFGAGIDIPDLDIIVNGAAHKSSIDTIQTIGRVKRKAPGKEYGYFIDFFDYSPYLKSASKERIKYLEEFGNDVERIPNETEIDIQ